MIEILFSFFIVLSDNRLVEIENFKIEILLFRSRRASIFFFVENSWRIVSRIHSFEYCYRSVVFVKNTFHLERKIVSTKNGTGYSPIESNLKLNVRTKDTSSLTFTIITRVYCMHKRTRLSLYIEICNSLVLNVFELR